MEIKREDLEDEVFTEQEMEIIYRFVDTGKPIISYREVYPTAKIGEARDFFKRKDVKEKIDEIGKSFVIYDTVADKCLLDIISNQESKDKDKIQAIKVWNDLRKRTTSDITINNETHLDLSNITNDNLESIVEKILKNESK